MDFFKPRTPGDRCPYLGRLGLVRCVFFAASQARPSTASVLLVAEGAVGEGGFIQDEAVVVIGVEAGGASEVRL